MKKGKRRMTTDEYKKIVSASVSEEAEQAHMMAWCAWAQNTYPQLDLAVHVPNEGKRSAAAGYKLKQAGMRAGFPDFFLPVPIIDTDGRLIYSGLAIELKKTGGRPTEKQIEWLEKLEGTRHAVAICWGAEAAIELIGAYCRKDIDSIRRSTHSAEQLEAIRPKRSAPKVSKINFKRLSYFAVGCTQTAITALDILINGTVTGRSLIIALALSVVALFTMIREIGRG